MTEDTYYAGESTTEASDSGFTMLLDDDPGSQIEATEVSVAGLALALGQINDDCTGWGEVRMDWTAAQTLADELNALLRQARVNGWA